MAQRTSREGCVAGAGRSRSAQHYLSGGPLTGRLEAVLTLISQAVGIPTVQVNILDEDTQHTIGLFGAGDPSAVTRSQAFCDLVVSTGKPLTVSDAARDPRFADFPAVRNGEIASYVGVPLLGREAMVIGAICVLDSVARTIPAEQVHQLAQFATVVEDQLDLIRRLSEHRRQGAAAPAEIAKAVQDGDIVAWYQPIVDLDTELLLGFEALARWKHPLLGTTEDPRRFVPVAEDSDLIIDLDFAVMRQALTDLKGWQQLQPSLRMSVNISARHLYQLDCVEAFERIATAVGVDLPSINLELTETSRLDPHNRHAPRIVREFREAGFQVWLDDFGTGWSSLDQLLRLPVDGINIDRAVTLAMGTKVGDALLVAVTGVAGALGLRTTIEGIESRDAAVVARVHGCNHGQGYLWGRPAPAHAITIPSHQMAHAATAGEVEHPSP